MLLVACPRCGAQFDVSAFAPGTTFICGACRNTLQVPMAAAPVVAPPVAPRARPAAPAARPAAPPGAKPVPAAPPAAPSALAKKPGVDRRRAGDAAPAAAGAPAGRAERIRAQRGAEGAGGAKKKSPVAVVLSAVAILGIVGGGIAFLAGGADSKRTAETGGPGTTAAGGSGSSAGTAVGAPAGPAARPAEKAFEDLDPQARIVVVQQRKKEALKSAAGVKDLHAWMLSKGLRSDAETLLKEGRGTFPSDPWINEQLGLRDRGADIRRAAGDEEALLILPDDDPNMRFLAELNDRVKKDPKAAWLGKEDSDRLDRAAAEVQDVVTKMQDPVYQRTRQEFDNLRLNPAFTGMEFAFESFRPYVIFAEASAPDRKEYAERVVQTTGRVLTFLYARWLQFMKDDLKLDPPTTERLHDHRFKVFVFKTRESFDQWHARNKMRVPQFAGAYYQHGADKMIMMHLDQFDPSVIMHEGTHQLIHFYARTFCEKEDHEIARKNGEPLEKVEMEDPRLRSGFFWFQEGIAEYFGGAVKDKENEGDWKIGAIRLAHLAFFRYMRDQKKHWPVEDFLFADQGQIQSRSGVRGGGVGAEELHGLMYAQGWTLVHYLLHGGNGKWREKFLAMIRNELCGKSGKPYLLDAFGLPKRADDPKVKAWIQEIEKGYIEYADGLVRPK